MKEETFPLIRKFLDHRETRDVHFLVPICSNQKNKINRKYFENIFYTSQNLSINNIHEICQRFVEIRWPNRKKKKLPKSLRGLPKRTIFRARKLSASVQASSRRGKPWPLSESIFDRFDITLLLISGQNGSHYPNNASRVRLSDRKRKLRRYGRASSNFRARGESARRFGRQATRKIGKMAALLRPAVSQAIQFSMTRGFSRLLRDIEADCCSDPCICLARYRTDVCFVLAHPSNRMLLLLLLLLPRVGARPVDRYSRGSKRARRSIGVIWRLEGNPTSWRLILRREKSVWIVVYERCERFSAWEGFNEGFRIGWCGIGRFEN